MQNSSDSFSPALRVIAIVVFCVVAALFIYNQVIRVVFSSPVLFSDYQSYHFAALTLKEGNDPYDVQNLIERAKPVDAQIAKSVAPYRHSLLELLPVIPLTSLDYTHAKQIWVVFVAATALLSVWLMMKYFLPWKAFDPPSLLVGSFMLLFAPMVYSTEIHQINALLLVLLLGGLLVFRKQKYILAALLLAIAIQSKFFVGAIILAFIFLKQYKVAGLTIMFSILLFAIPFGLYPGTFSGYRSHVVAQLAGGEVTDNPLNPIQGAGTLSHYKNVSVTGASTRLFSKQETVPPLVSLPLATPLRYAGLAGFLFLVSLIWRRAKFLQGNRDEKILTLSMIILIGWFLLASPITWQHHLVLLLAFIPTIIRHVDVILQNKKIGTLLLLGVLGSSIIAAPPVGSANIVRHIIAIIPFLGLVCLGIGFWMLFARITHSRVP